MTNSLCRLPAILLVAALTLVLTACSSVEPAESLAEVHGVTSDLTELLSAALDDGPTESTEETGGSCGLGTADFGSEVSVLATATWEFETPRTSEMAQALNDAFAYFEHRGDDPELSRLVGIGDIVAGSTAAYHSEVAAYADGKTMVLFTTTICATRSDWAAIR